MRICVYGAGAVGSHLAARLARAGADVSVIARGPTLAAVQGGGLRVEAPDGAFEARVAASEDPIAIGVQDVVIVAVKAPALPQIAAAIGPLLGPATQVVFAMNGIPWWYFHAAGGVLDGRQLPLVDPGGTAWRVIRPERAVGCVVYSACTVTAPGCVRVEGDSRFVLGRPDGAVSPVVEALAGLLRSAGVGADVTSAIRDAVWTKLLVNLGTGPMAVLVGGPAGRAFAEPAGAEAVRQVIAEGKAIAAALGCSATCDTESFIAGTMRMTHKPSVLQDFERGRTMEIAALYETPLELARMADVATPMLDLLIGLVKARARQAGLYP